MLIETLGADTDSRAIVPAVIDLGHNLNCEIIAEGIETEGQAELLRAMGCDAGQGYLFGRPVSGEVTREFLLLEARPAVGTVAYDCAAYGQRGYE